MKRPYTVTAGTFQMAIMLGFNTSLTLSFKDLLETTGLPEKELSRQVQSLLESKLIVVSGDGDASTHTNNKNNSTSESGGPAGGESGGITESTVLTLNLEYTNKRTKFKINAAVQKETPQVFLFEI